jgi:hypothetical protein
MWHAGPSSNMNFPAPVSVLGFLAGCGGLALSALAIVVAYFLRKPRLAARLLKVVGAGALVYFGLLFAFSLASHDSVLSQGQEKYFCEIDCHLAYSIVRVKTELAGSSLDYTVTLRTRFDETTISPSRPRDVPLTPNPRSVEVVDALARRPAVVTRGVPLSTPLRPGESYLTDIQFQVPGDAKALRLLLTTTGWPEHLLIGDEQSPLHGKTWFAL